MRAGATVRLWRWRPASRRAAGPGCRASSTVARVAGSGGGPLVKVARLQEHFPQDRRGYNLVYLLSNTPYLTRTTLGRLKRRKVPMVLNQNGVFYQAWFDGDWRAKNAEMAAAYHMADHVFWQSDFCRRCADRFLGEREGPGEVLNNAVDTGRFAPLGDDRPERPVTFLVAGKIEHHHLYRRIGDALEGLARLTGGRGRCAPGCCGAARRRRAGSTAPMT